MYVNCCQLYDEKLEEENIYKNSTCCRHGSVIFSCIFILKAREEAQLAAQRHRRNLEIEQQKKLEEMSRQSFEEFSQEEDEEEVIDIDLYIDKTKD